MTTMPWGRYKGLRLEDVPDSYLSMLLDFDLRDPLRSAVDREIECRFYGAPREPEQPEPRVPRCTSIGLHHDQVALAQRVFDAGYRTLALRAHPDVGGDAAEMRELNALAESVRDQLRGRHRMEETAR